MYVCMYVLIDRLSFIIVGTVLATSAPPSLFPPLHFIVYGK
jgi:hypothetical protein